MLGTFVEITAPAGHEGAVAAGFAAIAHVGARMSFHAPDSDLAAIRAARGGDVLTLDPDTVSVLRLAGDLHVASDGLFDVTIGRSLVRGGFLPRMDIDHLGRYDGTGADITVIDARRVRLARRVLVDLGGIAKGHAVDRAVAAMIAAGAPCGLVNAGGDLRGFGAMDWAIGLRDADGAVREQTTLRDGAMASSANLRDRRRHRGMPVSPHIGRGGKPVLHPGRVTVVAERCVVADAFTKIAMADPALAQALLPGYGAQLHAPMVTKAAA